MLRRTALLALLSLPLAGCVTYEVVDRGRYYDDGSYADRRYDPHARYDERYDDRYDERYERSRRYAWDDPRFGDDDPYDRWFYGWRGHGPVWTAYPWHGGQWYGSVRHDRRWHRGWGWGPSWGHPGWGHSPWGGTYWHHVPSRPWPAPPQHPRPVEPTPMPKPFPRAVRPDPIGPVLHGPVIGGEDLRPAPRPRRFEERGEPAMIDARPMTKPRFEEPPPRFEEPPPRFEEPPPRFEEPPPRFEEPPPRFEEPPPRFEEPPPRFEEPPPRFEEPPVIREHVE